jgi:hypothetical protein
MLSNRECLQNLANSVILGCESIFMIFSIDNNYVIVQNIFIMVIILTIN